MSLCDTCPVAEGCSFVTALKLETLRWSETGRNVVTDVTSCNVYEYHTHRGFVEGAAVTVYYKDSWRPGSVHGQVIKREDGDYVTVILHDLTQVSFPIQSGRVKLA